MQQIDERDTIKTAPQPSAFVEVRGPKTLRLRCWYNPATNELRFQDRKDKEPEVVSLSPYRQPRT